MSFTPGANDGTLNGTTAVDVVPGPANGTTQRTLRNVTVFNEDTGPISLTLRLNNNGTTRTIGKATLQVGEEWIYDTPVVLDAMTKKLQILMSAAATSVNPPYVSTWADKA